MSVQDDEVVLMKNSSSGNLWESVMKEIENRAQGEPTLLSRPASVMEDNTLKPNLEIRNSSAPTPKRPPRKKRLAPLAPQMNVVKVESPKSDENVREELVQIIRTAFPSGPNDQESELKSGQAPKIKSLKDSPVAAKKETAKDSYENSRIIDKELSLSCLSVNDLDSISLYTDYSLEDSADDQLAIETRRTSTTSHLGTSIRRADSSGNSEKKQMKVRGKFKLKAVAGKERMGALLDAATNNATGKFRRIRSIRSKNSLGGAPPTLKKGLIGNSHIDDFSITSALQKGRRSIKDLGSSGSNEIIDPNDEKHVVVRKGNLKKQGGKYKNWNLRWFVLRLDGLHYFYKENGKYIATIPLSGNHVKKLGSSPHETQQKHFLFEIYPGDD